jgi:isoleucyl-tRNA synthetase
MNTNDTNYLQFGIQHCASTDAQVLQRWNTNNVVKQVTTQGDKQPFVLYDGPPFPTGTPHHGTICVSTFKDAACRFFHLNGYYVDRVWGWDCHGLPIEKMIEKKLNIKHKDEISQEVGVGQFNEHCKQVVVDANESWDEYVSKMGRWVKFDTPYRTMDKPFMESVMWAFKKLHNKGLIYKGDRVTPYCYHCETTLSLSDTRESDSTRPKDDRTVTVKLKLDQDLGGKPTYMLVWTTTPWSLFANLALGVKPELDYLLIEDQGCHYILGKDTFDKYNSKFTSPSVKQTLSGSELCKYTYTSPFALPAANYSQTRPILGGDCVTAKDGTAVLHLAPAFGEDDFWLCRTANIGVYNPVDDRGCYTTQVKPFGGRNIHESVDDIVDWLEQHQLLFCDEVISHNYPHCWRCRHPIIYRSAEAWYLAVESIKDQLIEHNESVNWHPDSVKYSRFGKWLESARDWNISRNRFWGSPIPIWTCSNHSEHMDVIGSIDELYDKTGVRVDDLHIQHLDPLTYSCSHCDGTMSRVPEVLDGWFEAASMPFAQHHYPFENKKLFDETISADLVIEYSGQIRAWYYYMHTLSVALWDKPAFKNCIVHGTLLAEDGSKISKSRKNYTDPMQLIDLYGADALRAYLLGSQVTGPNDMAFNDAGVAEQHKTLIAPFKSTFNFFATYAGIDGFKGDVDFIPKPKHILDQWIIGQVDKVCLSIGDSYRMFQLNSTLSPAVQLLEDINNWYIRRSRKRFWRKDVDGNKKQGYQTLFYALSRLCICLSPAMPFLTDELFNRLTLGKRSVHFEQWPQIQAKEQLQLGRPMQAVRTICTLAHSVRNTLRIKTKQPLESVQVVCPSNFDQHSLTDLTWLICEEVNVKKVVWVDEATDISEVVIKADPRYLGQVYGKQTNQILSLLRQGHHSFNEIGAVIVKGDDNSQWIIPPGNFVLHYKGKTSDDSVAAADGFVVTLDSNLSDELIEEGYANEVTRAVQILRKQTGYKVSDRILLSIEGDIHKRFKANLFCDSLADETTQLVNYDAEHQFSVNSRQFILRIKKAA